MLIAFREKITGWIGKVLLVIILLAFSLFGLRSYLEKDVRSYAAKVNDREVSLYDLDQAYQSQINRLRQMMGDKFDYRSLDKKLLRKIALQDIIDAEVLVQSSKEAGFTVNDSALAAVIQNEPAFQIDGKFSNDRYNNLLQSQRMSPQQYEGSLRRDKLINQLVQSVRATEVVLEEEIEEAWRLEGQQRTFDYIVLPKAESKGLPEVSEQEIQKYFDENGKSFQLPEQVRIQYVELDAQRLGKDLIVSEDEVVQLYEEQQEQFGIPEERRASHILFGVSDDAETETIEEVRKNATDIAIHIRNGASLADLAKQYSDDPGSKDQGGDLGFFSKGAMVPAFENEVFAQKVGDVSDPIRTEFGFHIISLVEIKAAQVESLDQVRAKIIEEEKTRRGLERLYDQYDVMANLAFEHPQSLEAITAELDLPVMESALFAREGGEDLTAERGIINAAYSDDVLLDGNNSEPVEINSTRIVVLRVKEHQKTKPKELDAALRGEITRLLQAQKTENVENETAKALLERIIAGESLEKLAKEQSVKISNAHQVMRNAEDIDPVVIQQAFTLPAPATDARTYGIVILGTGQYALIRVKEMKEGEVGTLSDPIRQSLRNALLNAHAQYEFKALLNTLKAGAEISIGNSLKE